MVSGPEGLSYLTLQVILMLQGRLALADLGREGRLNCFLATWRTREAQAGPSPIS